MYKAFFVDKGLIDNDPHFMEGCGSCHFGDEKAQSKEKAHKGVVKRPSDNLKTCENCHSDIAKTYKNALHYTTHGQKHGVSGRFSANESKIFDEKVFEKSCRSCHASCGDCHVKSPAISGISSGLLKGHKFVKKDDGKTCALCHGGRVYPEFTGDYGGSADIHYQKGMTCLDCHKSIEFHGTGIIYKTRKEIKERPACVNCHKTGSEKTEKAKSAHTTHQDRLSCYACHSGGAYRNCYGCHMDKGATSKPGFMLGINPRDKKTITTLRLIPTVRDAFKEAGIKMERFDTIPNYWDTATHNIKKRTERTRSCVVCHEERKDFLTREMLIKNGSKANEGLVYTPKSLKSGGK
ncbi:MAG TPA: cytochrome c3 family protein [Syntrophorhabdaceae bacterium]|nr:cytochrome c3 family protein [Syntrophorhabdaceae bacterium]HNZ59295.1 cytochrome c3 family protein [Syntrophorhabdaceae bacterium]HOB69528.1 cytochrome c3 family protein [Syntrophorhabdaceae bacterium]HOF58246.1 cytochrome c3 family protein [Syntrophorhabdaceae bacterium]HOG39082.1 cytochrome c3 family protein [Syntrophorhabdaceae bacterium]